MHVYRAGSQRSVDVAPKPYEIPITTGTTAGHENVSLTTRGHRALDRVLREVLAGYDINSEDGLPVWCLSSYLKVIFSYCSVHHGLLVDISTAVIMLTEIRRGQTPAILYHFCLYMKYWRAYAIVC